MTLSLVLHICKVKNDVDDPHGSSGQENLILLIVSDFCAFCLLHEFDLYLDFT